METELPLTVKNVLVDSNLKSDSSFRIFWNVFDSKNAVQKCHFDSSQNCERRNLKDIALHSICEVNLLNAKKHRSNLPVSIVSANFSSPSNGWKLSPISSVSFWLRHSLASCMLLVMKLDQYIGSTPDAGSITSSDYLICLLIYTHIYSYKIKLFTFTNFKLFLRCCRGTNIYIYIYILTHSWSWSENHLQTLDF